MLPKVTETCCPNASSAGKQKEMNKMKRPTIRLHFVTDKWKIDIMDYGFEV